jgi:hypothetical protein
MLINSDKKKMDDARDASNGNINWQFLKSKIFLDMMQDSW